MENRGRIIRAIEAKTFVDGEEFIKQYVQTPRLTFGVSVLQPGKTGGLDPGHSEADEVFFCAKGHVLCYFPEDDVLMSLFFRGIPS